MSREHPRWVYVALPAPDDEGWQIGAAVEDEPGYHPGTMRFTEEQAKEAAATLNEGRGFSEREAYLIVVSTMRARDTTGVGL